MSFRGRLTLFFAPIVIVPMVALGAVLFALTARTDTGKADAGISTAARPVVAPYREQVGAARPALRRVAGDPRLRSAIVGDALATGLDRHGVVALAVRQAVDACEAEVGRALPLARGAFAAAEVGPRSGELERVIEAAERHVCLVRADVGPELLGALEGDESAERTRRAVSAEADGAHALSIGLRSLVGGSEYLGAISIARHGEPFTREEEELLEYLAGQAVVSIENASLHETVDRQAVTDELTGLANVRAFTSILDRELERSRRFDTPLGLLMLDLDDFKRVNDTYGHQRWGGTRCSPRWLACCARSPTSSTPPPATEVRRWR